jgi:hypothetical protein
MRIEYEIPTKGNKTPRVRANHAERRGNLKKRTLKLNN